MNSNDVTLEKNRTLSDSIKKSSSSNKLRKPSQKKSIIETRDNRAATTVLKTKKTLPNTDLNNNKQKNFVNENIKLRNRAVIDRRQSHIKKLSYFIALFANKQSTFVSKSIDVIFFLLLNSIYMLQISQLNFFNVIFSIFIFLASIDINSNYKSKIYLLRAFLVINIIEILIMIASVIFIMSKKYDLSYYPNINIIFGLTNFSTTTINFTLHLLMSIIMYYIYYTKTEIRRVVLDEKERRKGSCG